MESLILITKKRCSGVSSKFIKQNVDGILPESRSHIFKRPRHGKKIPPKDRFIVHTQKLVVPYNFIHNLLMRSWCFGIQIRPSIETLLIKGRQLH